ncbi:TetR/AcrR family transcriptional regulator [Oceanicoccus sp. KOV_DT_Chl]|uniref:TetR/AcrR family transcriptional regulator n=1 Tax=Oceanicoccus sp. KOV_DT_Chl TaxID=1904639 RepID=UPI000C79F863|nr:TetR/AcrR family transcriptional regulator [Oceanicoccus sp. KOV_DT_Chl]
MARTKQIDSDTRQRLILAGEQLIGEMGIEGISLRQINTAAGQKNISAAHYHFGTKLGLVEAIYDYRMKQVNERREKMLDQNAGDIRALIEAWVYPMVDVMNESTSGSHYIRFLAKVSNHADNDIRKLWDAHHSSGLQKIATGLRQLLIDIPEKLFGMRFGLAMLQLIHALAEYERLIELSDDGEVISSALFVGNLVDVLVASLQAPIASITRQELMAQRAQRA